MLDQWQADWLDGMTAHQWSLYAHDMNVLISRHEFEKNACLSLKTLHQGGGHVNHKAQSQTADIF